VNGGILADTYEADNTASTAKFIANGQTQTRNIHLVGNEDWVLFVVPPIGRGAANVQIATSGAGYYDTQLWLYWPDGTTQIAYNDDAPGTHWSSISVGFLPPGPYFIKVREYLNDGTIGSYNLRASWVQLY
jgi:hypothetical protein